MADTNCNIDFYLRPYSSSDIDLLFKLYAAIRKEEFSILGWPPAQLELFLKSQFEIQRLSFHRNYPDGNFDIVCCDARDAGRFFVDYSETNIHLIDIALLPEFRNRGIGTRLLNSLTDNGENSRRTVSLYTESDARALSLYRRLGFEIAEQKGLHLLLINRPGKKLTENT